MSLGKIVDAIIGKDDGKKVLEFLGRKVSFQLISSVYVDPENGFEGKRSNPAYLENWLTNITPIIAGESAFSVTFDWDDEQFGVPGASIIKICILMSSSSSNSPSKMFLITAKFILSAILGFILLLNTSLTVFSLRIRYN
ncbi:hypothetical protein HAX54_010789 [Datura stramonium]|uniref:PLAT domain-containing protein n=1 Tax=Datura stramonium TaxID=4076 RepID=A0ABS8RIG0_DATST|nr:hypothetical protein [Datura stramonium]